MSANLRAFLYLIRYCEGTAGENGYRTLFGGGLFDSFEDHPRQKITRTLGGKPITSSAAGAYQFLTRTWDECARALGLTDFSPESQDRAAVFLIKRRGALPAVEAGNLDEAIRLCNKEWASLPGSPYGQPVKTLAECRAVYHRAGGMFVPAQPEVSPTVVELVMPIPAIVAAAATSLLPVVIDLFKARGSSTSTRNAEVLEAAGPILVEVAKTVTGESTAEAATEKVLSDPALREAFRESVKERWFAFADVLERINTMEQQNISAARSYNTGEPLMLDTRWFKLKFVHLLSVFLVGFAGWFVTTVFATLTAELQGAIVTLMVIAGWNGVRDYWMGSSSGSDRKTDMMQGK